MKKAFTLAEVLITLTIIGVIAAITIPNLMQSWRKHERITQIKTAYSIIQNATKMAVAEHGNPDGWDFNQAYEYVPKYFSPYTKYQYYCVAGDTAKNCFNNGNWYVLDGRDIDSAYPSGYNKHWFYELRLQNGMDIAIWAPNKGNQGYQRNVVFLVDVNGKQGPTTLGKDIFSFGYNLDTGKFTAGGAPASYNQNDCTLTGNGMSCAYWIEKNHWEFPDDYPVKKF